ncbi:Aste57867_16108 [Aphanomyces stellatus]|uniref:Aste57867_16108 protein n=1 Tax=Aphanomyces stellatus TaxID=120398 RepID=A0A485L6K7_9STRA|nr:hypothetical protein As57867_016052 [Aphanomyces stellatus]VFT92891.1 Aste57867_16108 [Aphanomyces stellatus]
MLRSLGDDYKSITLPYWDFWKIECQLPRQDMQIHQRLQHFASGSWRDQDVQLSTNFLGPYATCTGWSGKSCYRSTGNNSTSAFCQSQQSFDQKTCYKCIPRNDMTKALVPGSPLLFGRIFSSQASSDSFTNVTQGVQYNDHNGIHAAMDSLMGIFASPGDPFLYIHHATVDALHSIYDQCVVKGANTDTPANRLQWPDPADWRNAFSTPTNPAKGC